MKRISQTMGFMSSNDSDEENQQCSQDILISVKNRLPEPNPLYELDQNVSINAAYPLHPNHIQPIEMTISYQESKFDEYPLQEYGESSLLKFIQHLQLIYQKYQPTYDNNYYATLIYQPQKQCQSQKQLVVDDEIEFDSQFESGNLFQVYKKSENEYYLLLQNDINTKGFSQWFYYGIKNKAQHPRTIRFHIININKDLKLYKDGMKILIYEDGGWRKDRLNLQFYKNSLIRHNGQHYYTLQFSYTFKQSGIVYMASNYPYSYSNLRSYLQMKEKDNKQIMKVKCMGKTIGQNECDIVTITSPNDIAKQGVVFLGRQHPGETSSSFVIEGIINYLLSEESIQLRDQYIFKIIPMVNVDGVINGNQRCGLLGYDMNRKWNKKEDTIINNCKQIIQQFNIRYPITLVLDIHGHSKNMHAFFYGAQCSSYINTVCNMDNRFDINQCRFMKTLPNMESTARSTLTKMLPMAQVYTLETSYCGYKVNNILKDFTLNDFKEMGGTLCRALKQSVIVEMNSNADLIYDDISQSDSNPTEDELSQQDLKNLSNIKKKKPNRSYSLSYKKPQNKQQLNKSQSIRPKSNIPKIDHKLQGSFNFVYGVKSKAEDSFKCEKYVNETTIFQPAQKPRSSEYSVSPLQFVPFHNLKQQFLNQALKRRQYKEKGNSLQISKTRELCIQKQVQLVSGDLFRRVVRKPFLALNI